jgi:hypothetical protein
MFQLPAFRRGDLFCLGNDDGIDYPIGCVGINGGPYDFGAYAIGYFEAAGRLFRDIHRDRLLLDPLVYPLCFLYRQGVELSIKHLLMTVPRLYNETCSPVMDHILRENWKSLRGFLVRQRQSYPSEPRISEATLNWVDVVLLDFLSVDPKSMVFRYPEDTNGRPYLQNKSHVNFTQLGKFMEPLGTWFREMIAITDQMLHDTL